MLQGSDVDDVVRSLHSKGLVVVHVLEDKNTDAIRSWRERMEGLQFQGVGTRDLALFTRQLATVVETGIPLVRGLRGIAADTANRTFSKTLRDTADRIERGQGISEAMSVHPAVFGRMYVSMIRAGERAGTLDRILEDLAAYLERIDAIKTKVRSALAYPVFVLIFAILATLFLLFKIVPTFQEIYSDMGQQLPRVTVAVIALSTAIRNNALMSIAIGGGLVLALFLWSRTSSGRYLLHSFLLRIPVFGPLVRKATMSRFARTLGILTRSGLPILDALDLVRGASGNAVVARAIGQARERIAAGGGITTSFRSTGKFPEMVLQMMATGEESGEMDAMLLKSSDFYDRQVEATVHGLTSLIEPLMIVLVGAMIGTIVVSMFLPIFYLGDAVMKGGFNL